MKLFVVSAIAGALIYGFIGMAEAGIFSNLITHFKHNGLMGPGQIPLPAFMFLLAIGIIGFLGIRRKG